MNDLPTQLSYLKLPYIRENYETMGKTAAHKQWDHIQYLSELIKQESNLRRDKAVQRRVKMARFPVLKTMDQFNWSWPQKINQSQIKNLFRLKFIEEKSNVVFIGSVGVGKTHIASALGYQACLKNNTVLFTSAIDAINNLVAAQRAGLLKQELKKYLNPAVLVMDELGYLPIDKNGADLCSRLSANGTNEVPSLLPQTGCSKTGLKSSTMTPRLHQLFLTACCIILKPL